jgi:two-component system, chemotaxis family, protein-glutamate methylesterase/glutaminase
VRLRRGFLFSSSEEPFLQLSSSLILSVATARRDAAWTVWRKVRQSCVQEGLGRVVLNRHDIVTIGASSGGVEALMKLVRRLPPDLPAAVFVVNHLSEIFPSALPRILKRAGPLAAAHPKDGDQIESGRIYVAPPTFHMLLEPGHIRVVRGPKENRHRPAVDPLFRTAARAYGSRVVGVVLTGALNDGTAGLLAVKRRGGVAVVQDPDEAPVSGMPQSALEYVDVDHCLPLEKIAPLLVRLSRKPAKEEGDYPVSDEMEYESKIAGLDPSSVESAAPPGELSSFSCPECAGPLYELRDGQFLRFRCRVGHAYTADSVMDAKVDVLENALYMALNTLEENAEIAERLAARSRGHQLLHAADRFEERAKEAREQAVVIRRVLTEDISEAPTGTV